ncbi:hypothetical protein CASFOL_005044 [Castilleja foliolosa]|uniref:COBRA C-terminal domain-containing protein n=1 Tax=Castilleja foliolosa TaxID=1961234 RepID=A0ABD3E6E0_9LAMI
MVATTTLFLSLFLRPTPAAPPPASDACNGIFLSYTYTGGRAVSPILRSDPTRQAYRFESTLSILNNDLDDLKSWRVFVGFQHDEYLVSVSNAVLADGNSFPGSVANGTVFAGFPNMDLRTGIEKAGDSTQMGIRVELVGTQFGVGPRGVPMPANISLVNDGWICPAPTVQAIELGRSGPGFEAVYSFNGTMMEGAISKRNDTIFMQGLEGLNYLVGETDGADPRRDTRVPGKQQSVISFKKKLTLGINIQAGDGFPTKVYFNGEECSLPRVLPVSGAGRLGSSLLVMVVVAFVFV